MWWQILLAIFFGFFALVAFIGRRHFAIRRRNCCGKGCGCLFPARVPPPRSSTPGE